MYQRYVSLGFNCEVAFQFRRVLGRDSSSFFSWNVTEFAAAESIIASDFGGLLREDNLEQHGDGSMVRDRLHNYLFHSPFSTPAPHADPDFVTKLAAHKEKVRHLVAKFLDGYESDEKTAYFYVIKEEDARRKAISLNELLRSKHKRQNFSLIILQDESEREQTWGEHEPRNRYLKRLAPWYDATDGHVSSYDKVFREFPFDGTVRFAGY